MLALTVMTFIMCSTVKMEAPKEKNIYFSEAFDIEAYRDFLTAAPPVIGNKQSVDSRVAQLVFSHHLMLH